MNYYERHIGDYLKDTAHLSLLEHGVYTRLLDVYYTREGSLPDDQVARLVGARGKDELKALRAVLEEFFIDTPAGWTQARCDREIARYQDKQNKARRSADARWNAQRSLSDGNANASTDAMRTHSEGNAPSNQTPDTRHHVLNTSEASPLHPEPALPLSGDLPGIEGKPEKPDPIPPCPHERLLALFAQHLPQLTQPRVWDGARAETMRTRWRQCAKPTAFGKGYATVEEGIAFWERFFKFVATCPALANGIPRSNGTTWLADLPWLLKAENFAKVIEGKYA